MKCWIVEVPTPKNPGFMNGIETEVIEAEYCEIKNGVLVFMRNGHIAKAFAPGYWATVEDSGDET